MLHQPFKELKIVELSSVLAGPAVGMFFAELGAEVIKIENKSTNGDVTRNWKLPTEQNSDTSAYYKSVNWGKQSMMLDLAASKRQCFSA
jgi:crotonobetainyl-CoA:carnitine CoA-transferase CaiB-like acyl-CoA transferase